MEVEFVISCRLKNKESARIVDLMFSDDAPIFADELPDEHQHIFSALEELSPPQELSIRGQNLQASWLCGSDFETAMLEVCVALDKISADSIIAYYWADEEQGFLLYKNEQLSPIGNWQDTITKAGIKISNTSFAWLKRSFKVLLK